ncbi:uncharacterized protein LOC141909288 [Tubulanus polymorphus]|uniref:uncharacterized protein LOC141909288 n=1 Tax=Tubulanus polymorphus TaxID=672921 RepID=UPI003DA318D0
MLSLNIDEIYFRFWERLPEQVGRYCVSPLIVPIRYTPHYRFARAVLQSNLEQRPPGTEYSHYIRMETRAIGYVEHSEDIFYANIKQWTTDYEKSDPIKVTRVRDRVYFIRDGAHRAAYAAANSDISNVPIQVRAVDDSTPNDWPVVTDITYVIPIPGYNQ